MDVKSQKPLFYQINAQIRACAECYKSPKEYRPFKSTCGNCGMCLCMACEDTKAHECYVDPVYAQLVTIDSHLNDMKEKSSSYSQKWQEMEKKLLDIESAFVIPTDSDEITSTLQRTYQEKLDEVNDTLLSLQTEYEEKQKELNEDHRKKAEDVQRRMHDLDMREKLLEEEYQKKRKELEEKEIQMNKAKEEAQKKAASVNAKPPLGTIRKAASNIKKTAKSPPQKRT